MPSPDPANAPQPLRLKIGLERREFWPFEPAELDIEISIAPRSGLQRANIPDMLDPGYEDFVIWIEEPDGERRRYRSPRHYCARAKRLVIKRGERWERDVSIFGESGAFTFRKVGPHRIQATFVAGRGRTLRSNVLEVEVKPPAPSDTFYTDSCALFTDRDIAQLIYHRRLTLRRRRKAGHLAQFADRYAKHSSAAFAHYALGRALAASARRRRKTGTPSARLSRDAVSHLHKAANARNLGDHRRVHAESEIVGLEA